MKRLRKDLIGERTRSGNLQPTAQRFRPVHTTKAYGQPSAISVLDELRRHCTLVQ